MYILIPASNFTKRLQEQWAPGERAPVVKRPDNLQPEGNFTLRPQEQWAPGEKAFIMKRPPVEWALGEGAPVVIGQAV